MKNFATASLTLLKPCISNCSKPSIVLFQTSVSPACFRMETMILIRFHFSNCLNNIGSFSCQKYIPAPSLMASIINMAYFSSFCILSLSRSKELGCFHFNFLKMVSKGISFPEKSVPKNRYTFSFLHIFSETLHKVKVLPHPASPMTANPFLLRRSRLSRYCLALEIMPDICSLSFAVNKCIEESVS